MKTILLLAAGTLSLSVLPDWAIRLSQKAGVEMKNPQSYIRSVLKEDGR